MALLNKGSTSAPQDAESRLIGTVILELRQAVYATGSSLADRETLDAGLEYQARSILGEALIALRGATENSIDLPKVAIKYGAPEELAKHGASSALRNVDPSEPLMAAEILFDIALDHLAAFVLETEAELDGQTVARVLHHAIWRRFPPGAIAYVEVLRQQLAHAYSEGRRQLSRELHDYVAQGILAGLQRLELAASQSGPAQEPTLIQAESALRDTLERVQNLAFDLRQFVGERDLTVSLAQYVEDTIQLGDPVVSFRTSGTPRVLARAVVEEVFAIVIEAVRNARAHASGATLVTLSLDWSSAKLDIAVSDDGLGSIPDGARSRSLGMHGMKERAVSIGAELRISREAIGTEVTLCIPLAGEYEVG